MRCSQVTASELSTVTTGERASLAIPGPEALHGSHHAHAFFHQPKDHEKPPDFSVLAMQGSSVSGELGSGIFKSPGFEDWSLHSLLLEVVETCGRVSGLPGGMF